MASADSHWSDHRVMTVLGGLCDVARDMIDRNLRGLTDEEYFWEPVDGCWSVRRRHEIRAAECWGRGDWVVEISKDGSVAPPMTTIAWRLMHAYDCTNDFTSRAFGHGGCDWDEIDVPSTAAEATELMTGTLDRLQHEMRTASDDAVLLDVDPAFDLPRWMLLDKALHESIHHCAEIGVLRALLRAGVR